MVLDILALVVLLVLVAAGIGVAVVLGRLPGAIAHRRGHPQHEAITVLGWIGIVTLGLAWPFALVWAYTRSRGHPSLDDRIAALESQVLAPEGPREGPREGNGS